MLKLERVFSSGLSLYLSQTGWTCLLTAFVIRGQFLVTTCSGIRPWFREYDDTTYAYLTQWFSVCLHAYLQHARPENCEDIVVKISQGYVVTYLSPVSGKIRGWVTFSTHNNSTYLPTYGGTTWLSGYRGFNFPIAIFSPVETKVLAYIRYVLPSTILLLSKMC